MERSRRVAWPEYTRVPPSRNPAFSAPHHTVVTFYVTNLAFAIHSDGVSIDESAPCQSRDQSVNTGECAWAMPKKTTVPHVREQPSRRDLCGQGEHIEPAQSITRRCIERTADVPRVWYRRQTHGVSTTVCRKQGHFVEVIGTCALARKAGELRHGMSSLTCHDTAHLL